MNASRRSSLRLVRAPVAPTEPEIEESNRESYERAYSFAGRHLVATYLECDADAMTDHPRLMQAMEEAVVACGATLLNACAHPFEGGGITAVFLLSESHASIHTYPEHGACFVDLFTCGSTCRAENFDAVLRAYLAPGKANSKILSRSHDIVDEPMENAG